MYNKGYYNYNHTFDIYHDMNRHSIDGSLSSFSSIPQPLPPLPSISSTSSSSSSGFILQLCEKDKKQVHNNMHNFMLIRDDPEITNALQANGMIMEKLFLDHALQACQYMEEARKAASSSSSTS